MHWARSDGHVVQEVGDELLVYDRERDNVVAGALRELQEKHLLIEPAGRSDVEVAGVSRRQAIRRLAGAGAAAAATPLIVSVMAPAPADASSTACGNPGDSCTNSGRAAGGCCS